MILEAQMVLFENFDLSSPDFTMHAIDVIKCHVLQKYIY